MKVIDVFKQYFEAECVFGGVLRRGASVCLTATSEEGNIRYEVSVSFFPHEDETDFRIPGDAFASVCLHDARGRRSRKKESAYLADIRDIADAVSAGIGGAVFWDKPLIEARYG
ncbi:MAG: hypothetical protein IKX86_03470 [Clostridia bacterium]|nr:hypothetical protein [Clostridia bacterium]